MYKHIEIKTYSFNSIDVTVKIDFDLSIISLVESRKPFQNKEWLFADRNISYMKGWLNILDAIKNAITLAHDELEVYNKERVERIGMELLDKIKEGNK